MTWSNKFITCECDMKPSERNQRNSACFVLSTTSYQNTNATSLSLSLSLFCCLLFKCVRLHDVYRKLVNNKRKKRKIFWKYDEDKCVKWPWTLDNEWHNFRLLKVRLLLLDNLYNLIRSEMGKSKLKLRRVEEVIFIIIIFCKIRRKSQRVLRKENGFE